jgi:TPR repeat protein
VAKNALKAVEWWKCAALQGVAQAQYNLGMGIGVRSVLYLNWMYAAGLSYDEGQGVQKDESQAVYWYSLAADKGVAEAQFALGM